MNICIGKWAVQFGIVYLTIWHGGVRKFDLSITPFAGDPKPLFNKWNKDHWINYWNSTKGESK